VTSRLVFGRDRLPEPWEVPARPPECPSGKHLVDPNIERCTVCLWLDPAILRCQTQGCDFPADWEAEVADPDFAKPIQSAQFCAHHALLGGISLVPGPVQ
jgi:hypothetical protein